MLYRPTEFWKWHSAFGSVPCSYLQHLPFFQIKTKHDILRRIVHHLQEKEKGKDVGTKVGL